jgi:hypothetical protein
MLNYCNPFCITGNIQKAYGAFKKNLAHEYSAWAHDSNALNRLGAWKKRPALSDLRKKSLFVTFLPLEGHVFCPSKVETFSINTVFLIHNFSFQN